MKSLSQKYPDDLDAATLYAESLMALSPWKLSTLDGKANDNTGEIVALSKRMKRRAAFSSARRFNSYTFVCTSYVSSLVPGVPLLSALPLGRADF